MNHWIDQLQISNYFHCSYTGNYAVYVWSLLGVPLLLNLHKKISSTLKVGVSSGQINQYLHTNLTSYIYILNFMVGQWDVSI